MIMASKERRIGKIKFIKEKKKGDRKCPSSNAGDSDFALLERKGKGHRLVLLLTNMQYCMYRGLEIFFPKFSLPRRQKLES